MSRRTARETALQALYQLEFHPDEEESTLRERGESLEASMYPFYQQLVKGVRDKQEEIDQVIERHLKKGWTLSRLSSVDRNILRLSTYELLFEKETPQGAVLNEAVELAKSFSGEESSRFINGVLGGLTRELG